LSTFIDHVLLNKDNDHKAKAADQHHSIGHKVFDAFKTSGTELWHEAPLQWHTMEWKRPQMHYLFTKPKLRSNGCQSRVRFVPRIIRACVDILQHN